MKGNTLLLSMLLLISSSAAFAMESAPAQTCIGAVCGWMKGQLGRVKGGVVAAKDSVVSAWQHRPGLSDVKAAFTIRNIKDQVRNLPTTINNHRLATAVVIGAPIAAVVTLKLWRGRKAKNSSARRRTIC